MTYRYSEDDNGSNFYVLTEEGWNDTSGLEGDKYVALYAAIMEAGGNPEWLEEIEVGKELLEEYRNWCKTNDSWSTPISLLYKVV